MVEVFCEWEVSRSLWLGASACDLGTSSSSKSYHEVASDLGVILAVAAVDVATWRVEKGRLEAADREFQFKFEILLCRGGRCPPDRPLAFDFTFDRERVTGPGRA